MGYFAYHRVSSANQKLDRGIDEINKYCIDNEIILDRDIFVDKQSGKTFDRPRYIVLKEDVLRVGDCLIITEVDRLGRNKAQIVEELHYFKQKGIRVMILELPTTLMDLKGDSTLNQLIMDTISNMIIELYACLAQAELEKKNKRQLEGIQSMKDRGDWERYGRPKAVTEEEFEQVYKKVLNKEVKPFEAIRILGVSVPTYYRNKSKYHKKQSS